jgi:hydrogenase maturation protease
MTRKAARPKVLVLGLGNPDRGDDAVGVIVAQSLSGMLPQFASLARRADLVGSIDEWARVDALVCVDAAAPMGMPGRIHRLDLCGKTLPTEFSLTSSHALSLGEAIELARALGLAPRRIIVYAIEGCCFEPGAALTAAVAAAVPAVAERIVADVRYFSTQESPALR